MTRKIAALCTTNKELISRIYKNSHKSVKDMWKWNENGGKKDEQADQQRENRKPNEYIQRTRKEV